MIETRSRHKTWDELVQTMIESASKAKRSVTARTLGDVLNRLLFAGGATGGTAPKVELTTGSMLIRPSPLAPGTVGKAIDALKESGLVSERARRPGDGSGPVVPLGLGSHRWAVVGINVSRLGSQLQQMTGVLSRLDGAELAHAETTCAANGLATTVEELVVTLHRKAALIASGTEYRLLGIGIATPGVVRSDGSLVYAEQRLQEVDLGAALKDAFIEPVLIENDVNTRALAAYYSKKVWCRDVAFVEVLDQGIGGALVIGGRLYRGGTGSAMEPGHLTVEHAQPSPVAQKGTGSVRGFDDPCWCNPNMHGHLECLATPSRIRGELQVESLAEVGNQPSIVATSGVPYSLQLSPEAVAFRRAGSALGHALEYIINIMNPSQLLLRLPEDLANPPSQANAREYLAAVNSALERAFSASVGRERAEKNRVIVEPVDSEELFREGARSAATAVLHGFVEHTQQRDECYNSDVATALRVPQ